MADAMRLMRGQIGWCSRVVAEAFRPFSAPDAGSCSHRCRAVGAPGVPSGYGALGYERLQNVLRGHAQARMTFLGLGALGLCVLLVACGSQSYQDTARPAISSIQS